MITEIYTPHSAALCIGLEYSSSGFTTELDYDQLEDGTVVAQNQIDLLEEG